MQKTEAAMILAGVTPEEQRQASAPTNLHVITGTIAGKSENGKTRVLIDGLVFSADNSQYIEIDTLGGLEEGDIATILLTGEAGHGMTPLAVGAAGSIDRIDVRIGKIEADYVKATVLEANYATITNLDAATARIHELEVDHVTIDDFEAEQAKITNLQTATADIDTIRANSAKVQNLTAAQLEADHATIGRLDSTYATITNLNAANGRINTLETNTADIDTIRANSAKVQNLTAAQLEADHATIGRLDSTYATITNLNAANGRIDNLQSSKANVADLTAATGRITSLEAADVNITGRLDAAEAVIDDLDANYIHTDMLNADVAWLQDGVIKNGAIVNGMIQSVSANKLTAGTIDASNITVTNLNADNITTGTINGQRIGTGSLSLDKLEEDVYTETEVDNIVAGLQTQIDGAIETWTGTAVPTLQNAPAVNWNTNAKKDSHVGDVYFVVNSNSQQNGYNYRFTKSGNTYSWQLIKDSDVTNALARLSTAEGKITTFDSDISTLKTDTGTLKSKTTSLETRMSDAESDILDKVDTTTFNEVSDTVDSHSQTITQMSTTLSNKADNSTVTAVTQRVSKTEQDISGINTTIGTLQTTVESKADGSTVETISSNLNTISNTVDGHTQSITSINSRLATKADGSTVSTLSSKVNTVSDTVDGHTQSLQSINNTLATKADSSTVSSLQQDYADFKQTTQQFESTIGTTIDQKVETGIANLEIGGRNLLKNSRDYKEGYSSSFPTQSAIDGTYHGCSVWKYTKTATNTYNEALTTTASTVAEWVVGPDEDYMLSFWAKASDAIQIYSFFYIGGNNTCDKVETSTGFSGSSSDGSAVTTLSTEWLRYWVHWHFNSSTDPTKRKNLIIARMPPAVTGTVWIAGAKLEKGSKATDWSPAPEDIESEVNAIEHRVSTNETSISNNAYQIGLRAKSSDVYTKQESDGLISTEVTNRNAAITESANTITMSVSQQYVTNQRFDDLKIGGRNLIPSAIFTSVDIPGSTKELGPVALGTMHSNFNNNGKYIWNVFEPETQYTFRVGALAANPDAHASTKAGPYFRFYYSDGTIQSLQFNYGLSTTRYQTMTSTAGKTVERLIATYGNSGTNWTFYEMKLEKGNRATDWTPAPEDLDVHFESVETAIEQNASDILLRATKTEFALVSKGTNLYAVANQTNGFLTGNGTLIASPDSTQLEVTSDFIPVGGASTVSIQTWVEQSRAMWMAYSFYTDKDMSTTTSRPSKTTTGMYLAFENVAVPSTANYIRVAYRSYGEGRCKVELDGLTAWSEAPADTSIYAAKAEIKVTTDGITSTVSKIGGVKQLVCKYANTLANIKTWSTHDAVQTYTVESTEDVRIGDTVYLKDTDSTRNCTVYIKGVVTAVPSTTSVTIKGRGYEDALPSNSAISSINQSAETIKIQASRVEIDGTAIFSAISSDVDDAITDKGYATTTQAQGYATTAVNNLEIGGTNLLRNSRKMNLGTASWTVGRWRTAGNADMTKSRVELTDGPYGSCGALQLVGIQTTTSDTSCFGIDTMPHEQGVRYIFSMYARVVGGGVARAGFAFNNANYTDLGNTDGTWASYKTKTLDATGKWTRIWLGAEFTNASSNIYIGGAATDSTSKTIQMCLVQIEKANKLTDWSPAPEDFEENAQNYANTAKAQAIAGSYANMGFQFKKDIIIYGESNKYYPVYLNNNLTEYSQSVPHEIVITRGYSEQAPSDWNTSTHKGSLNLRLRWNYGGWGGATYVCQIYDFSEMYSTMLGDVLVGNKSGMNSTIYLRGGGTTGAIYHIYSQVSIENTRYNTSFPYIGTDTPGTVYMQSGSYTWAIDSPLTTPNTAHILSLAATVDEQYIYISKAINTTSVANTTTWVTAYTDSQNAWTTKRPTYNSSYPVLFVAKQRKTAFGLVTCTTPVKDDTTTVIDGGNIITGTVNANAINASSGKFDTALIPNLSASQIIVGSSPLNTVLDNKADDSDIPTKVSDLTNDSSFQTGSQVENAITSKGYATTSYVDSIEIGGRNLLKWSAISSDNLQKVNNSGANVTVVTEDEYACYKAVGTSTNGYFYGSSKGASVAPVLDANTTYIYSAWIKVTTTASGVTSVAHSFTSLGHHQVYNSASAKSDKAHEDIAEERIYIPSTVSIGEWTYITEQFTTNDLDGSLFGKYIKHALGTDYTVFVREWKLEKGNKATDWSPAPEDVTNDINTVSTAMSEANEGLTNSIAEVSKSLEEANTRITNLTNAVADADADRAKWVQVDSENGITIGAVSSSYNLVLDNNSVDFMVGDQLAATASIDAFIPTALRLGDYVLSGSGGYLYIDYQPLT